MNFRIIQFMTKFIQVIALVLVSSMPALSMEIFIIEGDTLTYDTEDDDVEEEIEMQHVEELRLILEENPDIRLLKLESRGGSKLAAQRMANIIIDAQLDTHVDKDCNSSCVRLFVAGNKRTASLGANIGFHRGYWEADKLEKFYNEEKEVEEWETPFEFASWLYDYVQISVHELLSYFISRGVSIEVASGLYRLGRDEMWFPRREELISLGIITE